MEESKNDEYDVINYLQNLQCQFLCCIPIKKITWKKSILKTLGWDNQYELLTLTINNELLKKYPIKIKYQIAFLKYIIEYLEYQQIDIHDKLYEQYCTLINNRIDDTQKLTYKHYRIISSNSKDLLITLKESNSIISDGTTGLCSWQGSIALSEWILDNTQLFQNKCILELGCGIGLTGLIIANICKPKKIILTDYNVHVMNLLKENVALNTPASCNLIEIVALDWNSVKQPAFKLSIVPDIIVASDVIYDPVLFLPLINTLDYFFTMCHNNCKFYLSCTIRNQPTIDEFFKLLDSYKFNVCEQQEFTAGNNKSKHLYLDNETSIKIFLIQR